MSHIVQSVGHKLYWEKGHKHGDLCHISTHTNQEQKVCKTPNTKINSQKHREIHSMKVHPRPPHLWHLRKVLRRCWCRYIHTRWLWRVRNAWQFSCSIRGGHLAIWAQPGLQTLRVLVAFFFLKKCQGIV